MSDADRVAERLLQGMNDFAAGTSPVAERLRQGMSNLVSGNSGPTVDHLFQGVPPPSAPPPMDVQQGDLMEFPKDTDHTGSEVPAQAPWELSSQLDAGLRFFLSIRNCHGLYFDKLMFGGGGSPLSTSATGFGLIALAISAERNVLNRASALNLALQTLRSIRGGSGFAIARSPNGFMAHWPDDHGNADGELSTIDTAILVLGALFAANYFDESRELRTLAVSLATSVHWEDALIHADEQGLPGMSLQITRDGSGLGVTRPFNEYYLLAFCGAYVETKLLQSPDGRASRFFWQNFAEPPSTRSNYWGHELLSDHPERFLPSFVVQFCFYLSGHFHQSQQYREFMEAAYKADRLFWEKANPDGSVWGSGAGAYPERFGENPDDPYGYKATAIDENDALVYSAPILAGYLHFHPEENGRKLEDWHRMNDGCKYILPSGDTVLWRASVTHPGWRAPSLEVVDFSTLVLGLAHQVLGEAFFIKYAPAL
mmetsp:Transcript_69791/g.130367  ORF Transcript_69791/g.130367 Transcript_69791/m.130367 type:complete len:484 (+) Transcript_69791:76-1527(+)